MWEKWLKWCNPRLKFGRVWKSGNADSSGSGCPTGSALPGPQPPSLHCSWMRQGGNQAAAQGSAHASNVQLQWVLLDTPRGIAHDLVSAHACDFFAVLTCLDLPYDFPRTQPIVILMDFNYIQSLRSSSLTTDFDQFFSWILLVLICTDFTAFWSCQSFLSHSGFLSLKHAHTIFLIAISYSCWCKRSRQSDIGQRLHTAKWCAERIKGTFLLWLVYNLSIRKTQEAKFVCQPYSLCHRWASDMDLKCPGRRLYTQMHA